MRLRLLPPLTLALALCLASSAAAADWNVAVTDDFTFEPREQKIAVGDKVIWTFDDGGHTTTSSRGQAVSWDSSKRGGGFNDAGERFEKVFDTPGRFQYICIPHASFMKGTIQVGEDAEDDTVDGFKTVRRGDDVTIRFKLNEAAKVTYKLRGEARRSYARARLGPGRRSVSFRNLPEGRYRGTLTLVDDFDNKVTPRNSFVIR